MPTSRPEEVERILRYRIPSETPFLLEQVAWSIKTIGQRPDGSYLVRVDIVEKKRLQEYLSRNNVDPAIAGVIIEDEFLSLYQRETMPKETGRARESSSTTSQLGLEDPDAYQTHFYRQQNRLISVLVHNGSCVSSNTLSTNEHGPEGSSAERLVDGLRGSDSIPADVVAHGEGRFRAQEGLELTLPRSESPIVADLANPLAGNETTKPRMEVSTLETGGWILRLPSIKDRRLANQVRSGSKRDLLPELWNARASGRRTILGLLWFSAAVFVLSLGISFAAGQIEKRARDDRLSLDGTRELLKEDLEEVEAAQLLIDRVATWSGTGRMILDAWDRICAATPQDLALTNLSIRAGGELAVHGVAQDRGAIVTLMDQLRGNSSGILKEVVLGGLEERNGQQLFHVIARLSQQEEVSSP
jgi:hypothetical protein